MKIIPAPRKPADQAETVEIVANPKRLARKALVMDSDYDRAATPAISRAERALEQVRRQHRAQLPQSLDRLTEHHAAWRARPRAQAARERLLHAAHDLRGCAADLGQPLIGRIAGSLSRLIGFVAKPPVALLDAHIAALRAAGRPDAVSDDPVAQAVAQELEDKVAQAIAREPG
jgi:hypothetical protein